MGTENFKDLAVIPGDLGRYDMQYFWYPMFAYELSGTTILDVGSGISHIKETLACAPYFSTVTTQEPCITCPADTHESLRAILSHSFEVVTCLDVIEHIKDYGSAIHDMARIATRYVIVTTPGVQVTKCKNEYHWHEFETDELCQLFEAAGMVFHRAIVTRHGYTSPGVIQHIGSGNESFSREQLRANPMVHPIGLCYKHP